MLPLGSVAAGVCTALLAAAAPVLQAGSVSPIEWLRRLPPCPCRCRRRLQVAGCVGLLACGLGYLAMSYYPCRFGSYGNMVVVLMAVLLVTPPLALAAALRPSRAGSTLAWTYVPPCPR